MKIVYRLIGTKKEKKIYVRLYGNGLSIPVPTVLTATEEEWDEKEELLIGKKYAKANQNLLALRTDIKTAFNNDYCSGVIIDSQWLKNIIKTTFGRPNKEEKLVNHKHTLFLHDFGVDWMKNEADSWTNLDSNLLTNKAKKQKLKALEQFDIFQFKKAINIKLVDFDTEKIKAFYNYLVNDESYAPVSAKKILGEIKFLCKRADELKINVHQDYKTKIWFRDKSIKTESIYLNETEIDSIFNYDFSESDEMDLFRDNFILNLWTGLRIEDLTKLDIVNLIGGNIESISSKTNTLSTIPLHPHVRSILEKRFGNLPPKVNRDDYNIQIKEICRLCKIETPTFGKLFDSDKNRKIAGYYPKYKLVSSHIGRRSFATNLSNILSTSEIAKVGGWNSEKMVSLYNKKTKSEIAQKLSNHWNSK